MDRTLLIAGSVTLDSFGEHTDLIGGHGAYAAIAAAGCVPTQLWARIGSDFGPQRRDLLDKRRIDTAGLIEHGSCNRWDGKNLAENGPILPEETPCDPAKLGGTLATGLPRHEMKRALDAFRALPGHDKRLSFVAPSRNASRDELFELASRADVFIAKKSVILKTLKISDPVQASAQFIEAGATVVILTCGAAGGLLRYKNKCATIPTLPSEEVDVSGAGSTFAGTLAGCVLEHGKIDFRGLKRSCAIAASIASLAVKAYGPKRVISLKRPEYQETFNRMRRNNKY